MEPVHLESTVPEQGEERVSILVRARSDPGAQPSEASSNYFPGGSGFSFSSTGSWQQEQIPGATLSMLQTVQ